MIGQGTFGKVYQVLDTHTGQLRAAKTIKLSSKKNVLERLKQLKEIENEIKLLDTLDNVNIVKYY